MPYSPQEQKSAQHSEVGSLEHGVPSEDRQVLLRAAIADLNVMHVVLHEDRR